MFLSYSLHVSIVRSFTIRLNRIRGGVRSLKVTARNLNNTGCCYDYTILSQSHVSLGATQYSVQLAKHTHTVCMELDGERQADREGHGRSEEWWRVREREQSEGGREAGRERGREQEEGESKRKERARGGREQEERGRKR